jgi:hypothetical protein
MVCKVKAQSIDIVADLPIVVEEIISVTVYSAICEVIKDVGAPFIGVILYVRSPQKVVPSPFPHAKLTESKVKNVTVVD